MRSLQIGVHMVYDELGNGFVTRLRAVYFDITWAYRIGQIK